MWDCGHEVIQVDVVVVSELRVLVDCIVLGLLRQKKGALLGCRWAAGGVQGAQLQRNPGGVPPGRVQAG